jgi:CRP/FNR family cyclic AMP-dependent transcriptional regulator
VFVPLFQGLSAQDAADLAGSTLERHYPEGSILFLEGDPGDVAYIVLSGRVDLSLTSIEGSQLLIHQVGPGGYLGEMALLDGQPRSATATVAEDSVIVSIRRQDLLEYLHRNPDAAIRMLRLSSERLRMADEKIKALGFQDVAGRLARTLLNLSESKGPDEPISVHHDELAAMIGSRRPTVTTLLSRWRAAGFIVTARGSLAVSNRQALEELAAL